MAAWQLDCQHVPRSSSDLNYRGGKTPEWARKTAIMVSLALSFVATELDPGWFSLELFLVIRS